METRSPITPVILALAILTALLKWLINSLVVDLSVDVIVLIVWILCETLAVTVYLHRFLTHGSYLLAVDADKASSYNHFWMWWARSGGVRFWEWGLTHAWHHALTDTHRDSYTPWFDNEEADHSRLKPLRPWNFMANALSYSRQAAWIKHNPDQVEQLAALDEPFRRSVERLNQFDDYRELYGNIKAGVFFNGLVFTIITVPDGYKLAGVWYCLLVAYGFAALIMAGKFLCYVVGGYIINYYGHQAVGDKHQSNIPVAWMVLTFWMLGEAWHQFHHDAPYSARLHEKYDPGWWTICLGFRLGYITKAYGAELKSPDRPRDYQAVLVLAA